METIENEKKQYVYITTCSRVNAYQLKQTHPELDHYCTNNPHLFDIQFLESHKNDIVVKIDDK